MSYREIQAFLDEYGLDPIYDEDAGVYYVTYGSGKGDKWVSFDDQISFKAKIDLANQRGLGGLFIWAVDQDDDYYHALRAVTGKDVERTPLVSSYFGAFDLDLCYITNCGVSCKEGDTTTTHLNEDESGRGCSGKDHNQRSCMFPVLSLYSIPMLTSGPVCCPAYNAPDLSTCYWTGGPINCHGQCAAGEVTMVLDDYGDSGKRCTNGGKKHVCLNNLLYSVLYCPTHHPRVLPSYEWTGGY